MLTEDLKCRYTMGMAQFVFDTCSSREEVIATLKEIRDAHVCYELGYNAC